MTERRAFTHELRAKGRRLEGYAALFGAEARIWGGVVETIAPGAFAASLASGRDVLALVDHDPARVLARTRSGTLRLSEDARGLAFDLDVPDTQAGRDVLALAERPDLGGMSFGCQATDEFHDGVRCELRAVELSEVSVVAAWPAYEGTVVDARSAAHGAPHLAHACRVVETVGGPVVSLWSRLMGREARAQTVALSDPYLAEFLRAPNRTHLGVRRWGS